LILTDYSDKI